MGYADDFTDKILDTEPVEVTELTVLDVRGWGFVTIEFDGASGCDYSWRRDQTEAHGFDDDGSGTSTNITSTTPKIEVAGNYLVVDPADNSVWVHRIP